MRYWFKECPRCGGDLREESDIYGSYISCVQCGYILNAMEEHQIRSQGTLKEEAPAQRAAA